jgi:DNA-directed RNA polymerase specialized sigma24 family protein
MQQEQRRIATPADLRAAHRAPDARLLDLVRAGDRAAFDILVTRHAAAARRLAHIMVPAAQVDRVVAEALAQVRDATLLGRGPSDAFRPYLLTVLRRVSMAVQHIEVPADTKPMPGPAEPTGDREATDLRTSPIVRAFRSLPERWIAVLWHSEIEKTSAADAARILGVGPRGVAALRKQALDGLRRAYLQVRMSDAAEPECQHAARRLAARFRGAASRRDGPMVAQHVGRCDQCRAMYARLADIEFALRGVVARAVLGLAAASYMYAARRAAAGPAATEVAVQQTEAATTASAGARASAPAGARSRHPVRPVRQASRRLHWLGVGTVTVLAAAATTLLVVLGGRITMLTPTHHAQPAGAAPAAPPAITPRPSRTPTPSRTPSGTTSARLVASPLTSPAGPRAAVTARLSATVDVHPTDQGFTDQVVFSVADTGGLATGELTAWLHLPGSSLGPGQFGSWSADTNGWNCQQTWAGLSCRHEGIQAGSRATGSLLISIRMPEDACGRPVSLTAVSGKASGSAESPEGLQCSSQPPDGFRER